MFAVSNAGEVGVCLGLGHLPGVYGFAHAGAGVPGPDGHCGGVELGVGVRCPQSPRLLGCHLAGIDHVIETFQQSLAVLEPVFEQLSHYPPLNSQLTIPQQGTYDTVVGYGVHGKEGDMKRGYSDHKDEVQKRLRRIEGQIRGLQRMVDEDVYCIDVLTQVSAATKALQSVALELLGDHLAHCVQEALAKGGADAEEKVREAQAAIERLVRS